MGAALGPNTLTLFEPDEKDAKGACNPYLASYYKDSARWSFTMQAHLLSERYRMHMHAQWHAMQDHGDAILDRSFYGDTAFARLQVKLGLMSQMEFDTYSRLYDGMTATVKLPTICVRVLASPEVCNRRVASRMTKETGRTCETAIDLDYLKGLDLEIDHMVNVLDAQGVMVINVPWDQDRATPELRASTVEELVARIGAYAPSDLFLDLHRRAL